MLLRFICLTCALGLISSGTAPAKPRWIVYPTGIGAMKIGMTRKQLSTVLHESIKGPDTSDDKACYYTEVSSYPGVGLMILNGRLARIDLNEPGTATEEGIQVGDSEAHIRAVYGHRVKIVPDAYESANHTLTLHSADGRTGIRFVIDQQKVRQFYAGRSDAIEYIEGCE